jgi:glyoxylase-like metal-dependent hydrolase (beta-lactamase superfamily II)/rhodanese-related sulfurtransferase
MISKLTTRELADGIDARESFTLIDTRPEDSYDAWHIHEAKNVPFGPNESMSDDTFEQIADLIETDRVFAICGKGISSTSFALELEERKNGHDFEVGVVQGGMEDWSKVYEVVRIETENDDTEILQIQRRAKGCLGYIVGSRSAREAVAVDITRQMDVAKTAAQEAGLVITRVIDTHIHADHVSGGRALAAELDVPYHLSGHLDDRDVNIDYAFEPLEDSDVLSVGETEIEVRHTPGHTSEMINIVVEEVVLTSDILFANGVGRTELQFGEDDAAHGASLLYDSINEVLADLDDDLTVLPGHVTVTADGEFDVGTPGEAINARLGDLREELDVFTLEKDEFVERVVENDPEKPPNYGTIISINVGEESIGRDEEATELELGPNNCAA